MNPSKEPVCGPALASREKPLSQTAFQEKRRVMQRTHWNGSVNSSGLWCDSSRATHLPLTEDVPEQWQVLCSKVPERPDAPAMADGDQVQVIELRRDQK